jgi:hypothetical protein
MLVTLKNKAENRTYSKREDIRWIMLRDKRKKRLRLVAAAFSPFCLIIMLQNSASVWSILSR